MKQIKSYISQLHNGLKILCIGTSNELQDIVEYLTHCKKCKVVQTTVEAQKENLENNANGERLAMKGIPDKWFDVILYDETMESWILSDSEIACTYLIGQSSDAEISFAIWEKYRQIAKFIYIAKDKHLKPEEITEDIGPYDIIDWKRTNEEIEVSIILPVFNVEKYVLQCIETLVKWKVSYVEYIFVDDGSTDGSAEVIRTFAEKDKRIKLIQKPNGGCASARNRGIEEAKGKWIGFVDSDDFVDETMFPKLFRRALLGNFDLTYCGYQEYYEDSGLSEPILNDCLSEPYLGGTYRTDKVQLLAVNTRVAIWRCLYKKSILDNYHLRFHEDLKRFDDLPFRLEYIWLCKSAVCIPEYLYFYRLGRKGQDVSCTDDRLFVHFSIFEHLDRYVDLRKDQKLIDLLQIVKIQTHGFGLSKLEPKYKKEYLQRTKAQLDRNMGYFRSLALILMYTGKGNILWYTVMKIFSKTGKSD